MRGSKTEEMRAPVKELKKSTIKTTVDTLNACLAGMVPPLLALKEVHRTGTGRSFIGISRQPDGDMWHVESHISSC